MRLLLIFVGLAGLLAIPFVIWGDAFDAALSGPEAEAWLARYGDWAWAAAVGLLIADLVLPVPATAVMAALGIVYGPVVGGLIGAAGSFLSGTVAYSACRLIGPRAAERLVGVVGLRRGERWFDRTGGWAVAASRWLPLLPEVVTCLAGLARMPVRRFFVALACGCLPMALTFATVGYTGTDRPVLALALSAALPILLWPVADRVIRDRTRS
jgi:uncharacterized membrane protein YdjX (TVP38/TMEM64 family)